MSSRWIGRFTGAALAVATAGLWSTPAAAQVGGLVGRVTEAGHGRPIAAAQIVLPALARTAATDGDGAFRLDSLPAGALLLRVQRIGFAPEERTVVIPRFGEASIAIQLTRAATELAPLVVTATRESRGLAEVPAAVSVADSFTIKSGRSAGLHEVLRYTPGVQATSRYGLDDVNLSIRGSGIRTTFGVRGVAVLVDGVPVTEPDGLTRLDLIELGSARQVEVVRGPASALYGGAAAGGAINIITRSGAESSGLTLRGQRGSFDFEKYDASIGTGFADGRGAAYLSGAYTYNRGFRAFNRNEMTRFNLRTEYAVAPTTSLGLEASTSDLDMTIPGAITLAQFRADPFQALPGNVANRYARRDQRFRAGLRLRQELPLGRPVATQSYFFYSGRTLDHPIFQVLDQNLHRVQLGTRAALPLGGPDGRGLRLTLGADYDNLFGTDRRFVNQGGARGATVADGYLSLPSLGLYGQAEARLAEAWQATLGLRYDRVRYTIDDYRTPTNSFERVFSQVSPKGTLSYQVSDATSLYASVARGFEVPSTSEITVSPDPAKAFNDGLTPQRLINYELGLKSLVGSRLFLDLALFRTDLRGEFLSRTVPTSSGPRTVFDNAGDSRHVGFEVGWTALILRDVDLVGSYTFSDFVLQDFQANVVQPDGSSVLTDFSGKRLPGVPRHRLAGELRTRPLEGLTAALGAEWQSRTYVENGNRHRGVVYYRAFGSSTVNAEPFASVDPYALVHLSASYRLREATLFASIENLLDKRYVANTTINDGQGRFYSAGAGRYIAVGLSVAAFAGGL